MKKISLLLIAVSTIASAQLRVGLDVKRSLEMTLAGIAAESLDAEGMGVTVGYEQMLLSLVGVGAEYSIAGDEGLDMVYAYAVGKIPVGMPMMRGIVRFGYSMPMGDAGDAYDPGTGLGLGLRVKPPIFPIGVEALYTMHSLKMKDTGDELGDALSGLIETKYNVLTITATYSF